MHSYCRNEEISSSQAKWLRSAPHGETLPDVSISVFKRLSINCREMRDSVIASTMRRRPPMCLTSWQAGRERQQSTQLLDVMHVIVVPAFVTFHRPLRAAPHTSPREPARLKVIRFSRSHSSAETFERTFVYQPSPGHQLDGQAGVHPAFSSVVTCRAQYLWRWLAQLCSSRSTGHAASRLESPPRD